MVRADSCTRGGRLSWSTVLCAAVAVWLGGAPDVAQATLPSLTTGKTAVASSTCQQADITLQVNGVGDPVMERVPVDLMVVFDRSGSMDDAGGNPPQPITDAKTAAKTLVDQLSSSTDRAGLTSFATTATLDRALTNNFAQVKTSIDGLTANGNTNIGGGVLVGQQELSGANGHAPPTARVMVVLSDGVANRTASGTSCTTTPTVPTACTQDAIDQATAAKNAGTVVFTIGLNLNNLPAATASLARNTLQTMASNANYYFESPTTAELQGIISQIANIINNLAGSSIVITDILPSGVNYIVGSATPAPTTVNGQTLTWNLGLLNIGGSASVTFRVQLDTAAPNQLVDVYPTSRIDYLDYQGNPASAPFPETHVSVAACPTATPTRTGTSTVTATATVTATPSSTATPTNTATSTGTGTATPTVTQTGTATQTGTVTHTGTVTATGTPPPTWTPTSTGTATATPTASVTDTPTPVDTPTATRTGTATQTATATATPVDTSTATVAATATMTETPTPTPNLCGDGNLDPGEACDDGNDINGDGCETTCVLSTACQEPPYAGTERFVGSCGAPSYASIQAAVDAATDDDVITVCDNPTPYTQPVQVTSEVKIRAFTAGGATIHTTGTSFDVRRSGVRIEGLTIQSDNGVAITANAICPLGQATCAMPGHGSNLTIIGNTISNSPLGVSWQRRIDCALISGNTMVDNAAHIDVDQLEGPPPVLLQILGNTLTDGGTSGWSIRLEGVGGMVQENVVNSSAGAGLLVRGVPAGAQVVVSANTFHNSASEGIRLEAGATSTAIHQNNLTRNLDEEPGASNVGLRNLTGSGVVDATLNWWGSRTGPFHATERPAGQGLEIVESGGSDTGFIEFLCTPAPSTAASTGGICDVVTQEEVFFIAYGHSPDVSPNGRFISLVSDRDQNGEKSLREAGVVNQDGGDEVFVLNRKPAKKPVSRCLGGLNPSAVCTKPQACIGDPNVDPAVLDGACTLMTQVTDDPTGTATAFTPRVTKKGDVFFADTANLPGSIVEPPLNPNTDGSSEVMRWVRRDFRRMRPLNPNDVVHALTDGGTEVDSQQPGASGNGNFVAIESADDLIPGGNTDGNVEIFLRDTVRGQWTQITDTPPSADNRRPSTSSGQQVLFDSTGDLVGENGDGNREVFLAVEKGDVWSFQQLTHTSPPVENLAGQVAKRGRKAVFTSNGDEAGNNGDGNREIFVWDRGVLTQVTDTPSGTENVNPYMNPLGRFIAFESTATGLTDDDAGMSNRRVYLFDLVRNRRKLLSPSSSGDNFVPRMSKGRFTVWESTSNLTGDNQDHVSVVYMFDRRSDN